MSYKEVENWKKGFEMKLPRKSNNDAKCKDLVMWCCECQQTQIYNK